MSVWVVVATCAGLQATSAPSQSPTLYAIALRQPWPVGRVAEGVGFRMDERGLIVTAAHVLAGCTKMWTPSPQGNVPLQLVGLDAVTDLALLQSDGRLAGPIVGPVGVALKPGDIAVALAPDGADFNVTAMGDHGAQRVFAPALHPGFSGSPMLSARGLLVGVASAVDDQRTYVVGPESITRFLAYFRIAVAVKKPRRVTWLAHRGGGAKFDRPIAHASVFNVECN